MPIRFSVGFLFVALLALPAFPARAQAPAPVARSSGTMRVATRLVPPFVQGDPNHLEGFSIDLWNSIAQELGYRSQLQVYESVPQLLDAVQSGKADAAIAAISITSERERLFDFSQPMFESGLQILVRDQSGGGNVVPSIFSVLSNPALLQLFTVALVIILVAAHVVWFVERRHDNGIIETHKYFPGIFKAFWWAAGTLGAQADEMPKSWIGRLIALAWMFLGIAFVAYFTGVVTTAMTVQQLQGSIKGPDDLPGKKVAATRGSTSAHFLQENKVRVQEVESIDQAYDALLNKQADAVVFDSPVLLYYAGHEGKGKVQVVGPIFHKENYGILLPAGSPDRKRVNEALLTIRENGTYQKLYDKWFGGS